jgi:phenylpropionate dioxygenase-like ring-hydroxylating dioxygenase large terminal subunit
MTDLDIAQRQTPDSQMLYDFWYRALPSDRVSRRQLVKTMLLEIPLVVGRDAQGRAFAIRDACPHRGMPLSCGWFDGQQIECSYHGWKFETQTGQCRLIPSLTGDQKLKVERIYAGSFACEERDGYIWVFVPEPAAAGAGFGRREQVPFPAPQIETFGPGYKLAYLTAEMPVSVDHGIIGLMDPAHGPFVHQAWWWRSRHSIHEKQKLFEPIPYGFRMSAHTPSSNSAPYKLLRLYANAESITTTIDFMLPNLRTEKIRAGKYWFSSLTTVTPIHRNHCRIDVVAAWNLFNWLPFGSELLRYVFGKFVEQDRRTMEMQAEGLKHNPHMMLIDDADRPAKWYFQLKQAYVEWRQAGEFRHPMSGPVTLKWRS